MTDLVYLAVRTPKAKRATSLDRACAGANRHVLPPCPARRGAGRWGPQPDNEGATFPGAVRTVVQTLPPSSRSRGIAVAYSGGSLGALLTPLLVTPIAAYWGWRGAFWATGVVGAVWLLVWLLQGRRPELPAPLRPSPSGDQSGPAHGCFPGPGPSCPFGRSRIQRPGRARIEPSPARWRRVVRKTSEHCAW